MTKGRIMLSVQEKIQILSSTIWREKRIDGPAISEWLENFAKDDHPLAMKLLSRFQYYGDTEINALLRALFDDLVVDYFKIQASAEIPNATGQEMVEYLGSTLGALRWAGLGPLEKSGTHLLYPLRKEADPWPITATSLEGIPGLAPGTIVIFIDDICSSGHQAAEFFSSNISIKTSPHIKFWYLSLFGSPSGMAYLRENFPSVERVDCACIIEDCQKAFNVDSVHFSDREEREHIEIFARKYGAVIDATAPLGHNGDALLIGFRHNTPDNTLPIFHSKNGGWKAIFKRT